MEQGDILIRYKDDSYIIIFANASLEQGQLKAAMISEGIRQRLFRLNEEELRNIEIREALRQISVDFMIGCGFPDFIDALAVEFESTSESGTVPEEKHDGVELIAIQAVEVETTNYRSTSSPKKKLTCLRIQNVPICLYGM